MVRLSKQKRDALKASGDWFSNKETRVPAKWAAEAAEFTRLAEEANQIPVPRVMAYEPVFTPTKVEVYPDLFSPMDVFNAISAAHSVGEIREVYPQGCDDSGPEEDLALAFFFAMASKAAESATLAEASSTFEVPDIYVTEKMAKYLAGVGAFQYGRFSFEFADLNSFVKACLRSAVALYDGATVAEAMDLFTWPVSPSDANFKHNLAVRLTPWFIRAGFVDVTVECLTRSLFSGFYPDEIKYARTPPSDEMWEVIRTLFWEFKDSPSFRKHVMLSGTGRFLRDLGFERVDLDLMFNKSLRDLCVQGTEITKNIMDQAAAMGVVPRFWPFSRDDTAGSIAQLCKHVDETSFAVPDCVDPSERIDVVAFGLVSPFKVYSPSYTLFGGEWLIVSPPTYDVSLDDFEEFPDYEVH